MLAPGITSRFLLLWQVCGCKEDIRCVGLGNCVPAIHRMAENLQCQAKSCGARLSSSL